MLKKIQEWMANPKRKYQDGLAFFNRFASAKQKEDFLRFFEDVKDDETVDQFDIRFTTLVNQITFVANRLKTNPGLFLESKAEAEPLKLDDIEFPPKGVNSSTERTEPLKLEDFPEELSPERDRLKEIVPVMAKLHADMADEKMADDHRAAIRAELVKLDEERRAIWSKLDHFADTGKMVKLEKSPEETEVEKDMLALGAKTALRIGQLKSYIKRNQDALETHTEAGNQKKADNARSKIDQYSAELQELQKLVDVK